MSQKYIGRDSPGGIIGPHRVLKQRDFSVGFIPKDKATRDAADGGAHPKMRYVDLVCGARRQKPHLWGYDGIGRRVRLKI